MHVQVVAGTPSHAYVVMIKSTMNPQRELGITKGSFILRPSTVKSGNGSPLLSKKVKSLAIFKFLVSGNPAYSHLYHTSWRMRGREFPNPLYILQDEHENAVERGQ